MPRPKTPHNSSWYQAWRFRRIPVATDDGLEYDEKLDMAIGPPQPNPVYAKEDLGTRKDTKRYVYRVLQIWPMKELR